MVYYRKYRPQTISELDSEKVRDTLYAVLSGKEIPHAFLFTGPKGLGKTSTARIVAKVVNCLAKRAEGSHSIEPDNTCDQCISITNGTNIDVLEIDGASNRGIDEIRELRDRVNLAPSRAKKKIYIIDEVHMLTNEAFNALLKTIEEPPSHVMFVFCTTEPHKVPATIISRCFHVQFPRATDTDIVRSLERIVTGEKLIVEQEVLQEIAKMADGSFRDASKILEEVVLRVGEKKITTQLLEQEFSTANIQLSIKNLLEVLMKKDAKESLEIIQKVVEQGTDMKYFVAQILQELHSVLLSEVGINPTSYVGFSISEVVSLSELFQKAHQDIKYAVVPQLPLELAVVEYCSVSSLVIANDVKQSHTMDSMLKKQQNLKVQKILGKVVEPPKEEKIPHPSVQHNISDQTDEKKSLLENMIYKVKPYNHSIAGVLRGCQISGMNNEKISLQTAYKFHKEKLDEAKTKEVLEKVLREITGKEMKIVVELKQ